MTTAQFFLFQNSCYPTLLSAKFPRPLEWSFDEGEHVRISPSSKLSVVKTIGTDTAEIDLADGQGIMSVTWTNLHKYIVVGN